MRVLYSHRIQSRDGQSVHVEQMVAALRQAGHEVLVVGPGFYQQAAFGAESRLVAWIRARLPAALGELAEVAYNVPAYRRLRRAAGPFRPDIVYERYNLFYLAGALLARLRPHVKDFRIGTGAGVKHLHLIGHEGLKFQFEMDMGAVEGLPFAGGIACGLCGHVSVPS